MTRFLKGNGRCGDLNSTNRKCLELYVVITAWSICIDLIFVQTIDKC